MRARRLGTAGHRWNAIERLWNFRDVTSNSHRWEYPRASKTTSTQGWGSIRPRTIFNGGDPTGLVKDISWSSWGGATAVGNGMGYQVPVAGPVSAGHFATAVIAAFDWVSVTNTGHICEFDGTFPDTTRNLCSRRNSSRHATTIRVLSMTSSDPRYR